MLSWMNFIENLKDVVCIIQDENNNILYPIDPFKVKIAKELSHLPIIKNQVYFPASNTWYEYQSFHIKEKNKKYYIQYYKDITIYKKQLHTLSIDHTTQLPVKALIINNFKNYLLKINKKKEAFAIIMGDIDNFKNINDEYGHLIGADILHNIGQILIDNTAPEDILGRFGGEEFIIIFTNITKENSHKKIDKIRQIIQNTPLYKNDKIEIFGTMTFGVVHSTDLLPPHKKELDDYLSALIGLADTALYQGKESGKNKVVMSSLCNKKE